MRGRNLSILTFIAFFASLVGVQQISQHGYDLHYWVASFSNNFVSSLSLWTVVSLLSLLAMFSFIGFLASLGNKPENSNPVSDDKTVGPPT